MGELPQYHSTTLLERPAPDVMEDQTWKKSAACLDADSELFVQQDKATVNAALKFCKQCVVQSECLEYALNVEGDQFGTWGGKSEAEIQRMRRQMKYQGTR